MRKVRVDSMADFDALPEGEWVEVPDGMKWLVPENPVRIERGKLVIPLPRGAKKALNARMGDVLEARFAGKSIVVSARRTKKNRRSG